jgi:hypothetical protein
MSHEMKWSRLVYCAAVTALTTFLVTRGISLWFTVPLGAFAAWWTVECTRALWTEVSFRIAAWRLHQAPSLPIDHFNAPRRKVKRWEWLSNPKSDSWIDAATIVGVLIFPALLWFPLILWLLLQK